MPDTPTKFIFLSYGHDALPLAERVKVDLESRGYEVWFDRDALEAGHAWEFHIEQGVARAAAAGVQGAFLLLMTPRALRRSDHPASEGFCLKELRVAVERNLFIVPVMIETTAMPILINGLQWFDLTSCVPIEEHEDGYRKAFDRLVHALESGTLDFQGIQASLQAKLRPIDFSPELRRLLRRFIGREWLFAKLDRWLADDKASRIFWLVGGPGSGKSALAAKYEETRPQVAALHFCRFGQTDTLDARRTLMSIAYQLATHLPDYRDALNAIDFADLANANATKVFDRLFVQTLPTLNPVPGQITLIVVDGLDEATSDGANPLADVLARDFSRTSDWLRLLVTSRPESEIREALQGFTPEVLESTSSENLADAHAFILKEFAPFAPGGAVPAATVEAILDRSERLFLYLEWALNELVTRSLSLDRVEAFPRGLGGVYDQAFKRQFPDMTTYKGVWRTVLEVIVAGREPLESSLLSRLFHWSEYEERDALAVLGSMFVDLAGRVRPFHKSLYEWLTNKNTAGRYFVSDTAGHQALAERGWQEWTAAGELSIYFLRHLPSHLAAAGRQADCERLLVDYRWIRAKLRAVDSFSLLADYRLASAGTADTAVRLVRDALRRSTMPLTANPAELPGQLYGRLLGFEQPEIRQLLAQIAESRLDAWLKPLAADFTPPGSSLIATLTEPARTVTAIAFSPDGGTVVFASSERDRSTGRSEVKVWHIDSDGPATVLCESSIVDTLAVAPDGDHVVIVTGGVATVWPLTAERAESTRLLAAVGDNILALSFGAGGQSLLALTVNGVVQTWDLTRTPPTLASTDNVNAALASGGCVAMAAVAGLLFVGPEEWSLREGRPGRKAGIRADRIAVTPDASRILVASSTAVEVWTRGPDKSELAFALPKSAFIVTALAISADGQRGACASFDDLKIWDLSAGQPRGALSERESTFANSLVIDSRGSRAVALFTDGAARVWDLATLQPSGSLEVAEAGCLMSTASERSVITFGSRRGVVFHDLDRGESRLVQTPVAGTCVAITPDATRAFTARTDGTLVFWDLESGRVLHTLDAKFATGAGAIAVFPDGGRAVVSAGYNLTVWDLEHGQPLRTLTAHTWFIDCVTVSQTPAGCRIVSGSRDRSVRIWDPERTEPLFTLTGHSYTVLDVHAFPGGRQVMSCCPDGTLRIWNLLTGQQEMRLTTDLKLARCTCSPDGTIVMAGDLAGRIHFFSVVQAEPVAFAALNQGARHRAG